MPDDFTEDFLKKIIFLEKIIGEKVNYQILEPFAIGLVDIVTIQDAAKRLALFIGLNELSFMRLKLFFHLGID